MANEAEPKIPKGSGIGIASIVLAGAGLVNPGLLFPAEGLAAVLGLVALVTGRGRFAGLAGLALSLLVLLAVVPTSLGGVRPKDPEREMIGDLRSIHSAEQAYASATGGTYGSIVCLQQPSSAGCLAGYPPSAPTFLDATWTRNIERRGYDWRFVGAPTAAARFERFCFQARPRREAVTDNARSLGIDEKGQLGRYDGLTDCCGPDGVMLPICSPMN